MQNGQIEVTLLDEDDLMKPPRSLVREVPQPILPEGDPVMRKLEVVRPPSIGQILTELAFTRIEPITLWEIWPWVLKGLETVKRCTEEEGGHVSYTPAHIRNSVFNRQADLYVVTEDGIPTVFAVLTVQNDPFLLVPTTLHVWIEYSESQSMRTADFAHQEIIALGRRLCLEEVNFLTSRGVWERRLRKIGMKPTMTFYSLKLFHPACAGHADRKD